MNERLIRVSSPWRVRAAVAASLVGGVVGLQAGMVAFDEGFVQRNYPGVVDLQAGDVDGDGDIDLIGIALPPEDEIVWWENPGGDASGTTWQRRNVEINAEGPSQIAVGFIDDDDFLDVVALVPGELDVRWYRNPGADGVLTDPTWEASILEAREEGLFEVRVVDVDGDGRDDVVVTAIEEEDLIFYPNPGGDDVTGLWDDVRIETRYEGISHLDVGDIDGDGDVDLVVSSAAEREIRWYRNPGGLDSLDDANWSDGLTIVDSYDNPADVLVADMNGDAPLDVVSFSLAETDLGFWLSPGGDEAEEDTNWTNTSIDQGFEEGLELVSGDFDGDMDTDLMISVISERRVECYGNPGPDGVTNRDLWEYGVAINNVNIPGPMVSQGFDGPGGFSDLALVHFGDEEVRWYQSLGEFIPPPPLVITDVTFVSESPEGAKTFSITFTSQEGEAYEVWTSADLVTWEKVLDATGAAGVDETTVVVELPAGFEAYFIRVSSADPGAGG